MVCIGSGKSKLGFSPEPGEGEPSEARVEEYDQRQAVAKQGVKRIKKRIKNLPKPNVKFNISYYSKR